MKTGQVLLFLLLLVALCCALAVTQDDLEAQLETIQQQMQSYLDKGQVPPAGLMEQLQKLIEEMEEQQRADDEEPEPDPDHWVEVPFSGTFTIHRVSGGCRTLGDLSCSKRESAQVQGFVTGCHCEYDPTTGELDTVAPEGRFVAHLNHYSKQVAVSEDGTFTISRTLNASHTENYSYNPTDVRTWVTVMVNPGKGLAHIDLPSCWAEGTLTERVSAPGVNEVTTHEGSWSIGAPTEKPEESKFERPWKPGSAFISGSATVPMLGSVMDVTTVGALYPRDPETGELQVDLSELREGLADLSVPVTYSISWCFNLEGGDGKVVLEPAQSYPDWLPGLLGGAAPNLLEVTARIEEPQGAKGVIEFRLEDISREPGVACNWPKDDPSKRYDMEISRQFTSESIWVSEDGLTARTRDPVTEATITVASYDYGGSCKVLAEARLETEPDQAIAAHYEALGTPFLPVPQDDDSNGIADGWERQHELVSCDPAGDDDTTPKGSGPGDGLSNYEEYRGVLVGGRHIRLDPKVKDLFVYDPDGLVAASYFEAALCGVKLHYCNAEELRADPPTGAKAHQINANFETNHLVDQHGFEVRGESGGPAGVNGHCQGSGPKSPGAVSPYVVLYLDNIASAVRNSFEAARDTITERLRGKGIEPNDAWLAGQVEQAVKTITTHECGHAVGIVHHAKTLPPGASEETFDPSTGAYTCVMRYLFDYSSDPNLPVRPHDDMADILAGLWPWPDKFCDTLDNCQSQITISDLGG